MSDPFIESLPEALQSQGEDIKNLWKSQTYAAYASGRSMIAVETEEKMEHYLSYLDLTQEQVREEAQKFEAHAQKLSKIAETELEDENIYHFTTIARDMREHAKTIRQEREELQKVIGEIKDYIKLMERIRKPKEWLAVFNLRDNLEDVRSHCLKKLELDKHKVALSIVSPNIPVCLCPPKVGRVVSGLIRDCFERLITDHTVTKPKIQIKAFEEEDVILVQIENNGKPIPYAEQGKLFSVNHAVNSPTHSLYLLSRVIQAMHPKPAPPDYITAEKRGELGGACYQIKLPKNPAEMATPYV